MSNSKLLKNLDNLQQYKQSIVHYGHDIKKLNPKMIPYISSIKYNYHILNLIKTSKLLKIASNILYEKAKNNGKFLFISTLKKYSNLIKNYALNCNNFYINNNWVPGTFTNWNIIQQSIKELINLETEEKNNYINCLSKKDISLKKKKKIKLNYLFEGIKNMNSFPAVVIFITPLKDKLALKECLLLGIPTIAILDTNTDPDLVQFPISGNTDSDLSINFILDKLIQNILLAKKNDFY